MDSVENHKATRATNSAMVPSTMDILNSFRLTLISTISCGYVQYEYQILLNGNEYQILLNGNKKPAPPPSGRPGEGRGRSGWRITHESLTDQMFT